MKCPTCGEENCEEKRAAFAREPWLPNGFEIGAQWYSPDGGLTWERFPSNVRPVPECHAGAGTMTVTGVDMKTGTVTVKVGQR